MTTVTADPADVTREPGYEAWPQLLHAAVRGKGCFRYGGHTVRPSPRVGAHRDHPHFHVLGSIS